VALHHQGVPKINAKGELVDAKGAVIREGEDPGRIVWVANEGTRVSRLVRHITATDPPTPAMRAVRDELLATWRATSSPAAQLAAVDERRGGLGPVPSKAAAVEASSVTVDVPLRITIGLGPATRP
jgi:endonuclease G, mitochondrial